MRRSTAQGDPIIVSEIIRSRSNPLVKRLRALKARAAEELCLIEGIKLLDEALAAGIDIVEVAAAPRLAQKRPEILDRLRSRRVRLRWVEEDILAGLSEMESSQGILALGRRPVFDERSLYRSPALIMVAAAVQDPANVGALMRTAEAAGATGAYLAAGAADPLSWKALRGSMGSAFRLPQVGGLAMAEILERVRQHGVSLIALDAHAHRRYDETDLRQPVAFILGAEGAGLPPPARQAATLVRIPMASTVESLNVAVSAGIVLYEAVRQRGFA